MSNSDFLELLYNKGLDDIDIIELLLKNNKNHITEIEHLKDELFRINQEKIKIFIEYNSKNNYLINENQMKEHRITNLIEKYDKDILEYKNKISLLEKKIAELKLNNEILADTNNDSEKCNICYNTLKENDKITLNCHDTHYMCCICYYSLLTDENTLKCPYCREDTTKK